MRYIIQIWVMIFDVALICAMAYSIYHFWDQPITWLMIIITIAIWVKQGGLMAWNPKVIKKFLENAKKAGL